MKEGPGIRNASYIVVILGSDARNRLLRSDEYFPVSTRAAAKVA